MSEEPKMHDYRSTKDYFEAHVSLNWVPNNIIV